jgi:hypothetical protein
LVTIVGGSHVYPHPDIQTGYDYTDNLWAFFSRFLADSPNGPAIVSQPADNIQPAGQPASFQVTANGAAALAYRWQRDGEDIPEATENWLTLPAVTPADNGATFRAVVSGAGGTVSTRAATLTVAAPIAGPPIAAHPRSQTVAAGRSATFSVAVGSTRQVRYQWRRNGVVIPGATAASYTLPVTTPFDSGAAFSAVVVSASGTTASLPATLTVMRPKGAPIILTNPTRARVLVGQSGTSGRGVRSQDI